MRKNVPPSFFFKHQYSIKVDDDIECGKKANEKGKIKINYTLAAFDHSMSHRPTQF